MLLNALGIAMRPVRALPGEPEPQSSPSQPPNPARLAEHGTIVDPALLFTS
jgi:hypothetical protein